MTQIALARALGISPALVCRLKKRGLPADDLEGARRWLSLRESNRLRGRLLPDPGEVNPAEGPQADGLDESIPRIRRLEKALAMAAERAFNEGKIPEAISLRREHVAALKAVFDAETKLIKINESRGRLISVDRALSMVNEAMQSAILVLRRLPELGRDPDERRRLEAFLNAVLSEIKTGAADGLKHAA